MLLIQRTLWGSDQELYQENGYRQEEDAEVAKFLAAPRKPKAEDKWIFDDVQVLLDSLLIGKVVSRNFRGLLKRGDICVRVEYAKAEREKLTELEQGRLAFEEGSLETSINGRKAEKLFDFISSTCLKSKVMEDVYYQTKDETDRKGGLLDNYVGSSVMNLGSSSTEICVNIHLHSFAWGNVSPSLSPPATLPITARLDPSVFKSHQARYSLSKRWEGWVGLVNLSNKFITFREGIVINLFLF